MKIKFIAVIAFLALGVIVLFSAIKTDASKSIEYKNFIKSAQTNAEKGIPYIAVSKYNAAFEIKTPDEKTYIDYLKQTQLLGEDFYSDAVKNFIVYCPESTNAYDTLCKYYYEAGNKSALMATALEAREKGIASNSVKEMYFNTFYSYQTVSSGFEEANTFIGDTAAVKSEGKYGFVNTYGSFSIKPQYTAVSNMLNGSTAVSDGKTWFMINSQGYKVAVPSKPLTEMGMLSNERILVKVDGKYDYMSSGMEVPEKPRFDAATNYKNGVAAVKQGEKWALLGSDDKKITDLIFDDIIIDEFKTCINNGIVFAKTEGKYYMYDAEGKKIGKTGFDNACMFASDGYAAVCVGGKWGFADSEGNIVIEPTYEEAKSFCCGLAPVKVNGKWGYITTEKETDDKGNMTGYKMRIEAKYDDCKPFASNGIAAVKDGSVWSYIQVFGYTNY